MKEDQADMDTAVARACQYLSRELGISGEELTELAPEVLVAMEAQVRRQQEAD